MTVKLILLKSGEEVISDVKEFRDSEDNLVSYLFKDPYCLKIKKLEVLLEEKENTKHEVIFYKWISLSKDDDVIVDKDWIVAITEPIDSIKKSYEEKINGRNHNVYRPDDRGTDNSSNFID